MAEEIPHVRYEDICNKIKSILQSLNRWSPNQETLENVHVYVDGSAIEFVRSLKMMVGEDDNPQYWKEQLEQCRKYDMNAADFMTIIPINFGAGGAKDLLVHAKSLARIRSSTS